jgi:membrane-bound serine protease (ClpP class)
MIRPALIRGAALIVLSLAATAALAQDVTAPQGARVRPDGWFAPRQFNRSVTRPTKIDHVFVLPMREEIGNKTLETLKRKIIHIQTHGTGTKLVIIDMDTWGGLVISALDIARLLKTELSDIYTVCYARTRAISAGALIACACDEIIMTPVGKLGDCAPIMPGATLGKVEREKSETVLREEFVESAKQNGYSTALAETMVTAVREVWLVRHVKTRELRYVLAREWRDKIRPASVDAEWERLQIAVAKDELLTMAPSRAVEYGFVEHLIDSKGANPLSGLMDHFGFKGKPVVLEDTWSESAFGFLASPLVFIGLIVVALLAAYTELRTPGLGIPGAIAVAALVLAIGGRHLMGMALWWEIAFIAIGLIFIALEVLVIPGFGVAGISGIACLLFGVIGILVANAPDEMPIPKTGLGWEVFADGVFALGVAFVLALVAMPILSKFLPRMPIASKLIIAASEAAVDAPVTKDSAMMRVAVGDSGVVHSVCRPVGKVRFDNDILDAMSEGDIIAPGAAVRVLRREGNRLIVERIG